ncbi:MAG: L-lactate dehydrogenase [Alphaproteobacteria bacterium]|nr:L-lactate dehydrogenase [Alphaproteobacteria bacterium]
MQIGIIGAGSVGAATAFALMMKGIARKITLVDVNEKRALAEAEDIAHAAPFADANKVKAGSYEDLQNCSIIVVTAGANQKVGETRTDLLERNVKIFSEIIPQAAHFAPNAIFIIATNPVDVMTYVAIRLSGLPYEHIIGSGTVLDTARFRTDLGYYFGVSPKSIHANVLGEHGDSEVICWSNGDAGTLPLSVLAEKSGCNLSSEVKSKIEDDVRNAAYRIIEGKGATCYGIAGAISRICQSIAANEYAILTVSAYHQEVAKVHDVCLSLPAVIGKRGIHRILHPELSAAENALLNKSAAKIKELMQQADQML